MSSNEGKAEEMIEMSHLQVSEQGSPGKLVPEDCVEAGETDERDQEADNRTRQPVKETEAEEPINIVEEYNWPVTEADFEGRDVVVIAINDTKEARHAFDWYMTFLHREENLVVVVHALEIRQRPALGLYKEDWKKEKRRILDTRRELLDTYRSRFINLKLNGAIVSGKGDGGQYIIHEAKKRKAAYIMIGKRNQDASFHRVFTRSTTDFVVFNSDLAVLVCKMDPRQSQILESCSVSMSSTSVASTLVSSTSVSSKERV